MALIKTVNGVHVQMTSAEEAAILAEWAAWIPPDPPVDIVQLLINEVAKLPGADKRIKNRAK